MKTTLTHARHMEADAFRDLQAFRGIMHNVNMPHSVFAEQYKVVLEDLEDRWHDAYDNLSDCERHLAGLSPVWGSSHD